MSNEEEGGDDDERASGAIFMDGRDLLINMTMGALRRQAVIALGGKIDANGRLIVDDDHPRPDSAETQELMVRMAAQGMKDVLHHGMLGLEEMKDFVARVTRKLAEDQAARRGLT